MTNQELNVLFATHLMGWTRQTYSNSSRLTPWWNGTPEGVTHTVEPNMTGASFYDCDFCVPWQPTENIAQAIQCARKAQEDGKISSWGVDVQSREHVYAYVQPVDGDRITLGGDFYPPPPLEELLCRALWEAIAP